MKPVFVANTAPHVSSSLGRLSSSPAAPRPQPPRRLLPRRQNKQPTGLVAVCPMRVKARLSYAFLAVAASASDDAGTDNLNEEEEDDKTEDAGSRTGPPTLGDVEAVVEDKEARASRIFRQMALDYHSGTSPFADRSYWVNMLSRVLGFIALYCWLDCQTVHKCLQQMNFCQPVALRSYRLSLCAASSDFTLVTGSGPGKLTVMPTKRLASQSDLSLAYSPGVAAPCEEIAADPTTAAGRGFGREILIMRIVTRITTLTI